MSNYLVQAQTPGNPPTNCSGTQSNPTLRISPSNATFTFNLSGSSLSDFTNSKTLNNTFTVTVSAAHAYTLYVAGEVTAQTGSPTNTPIPINAFTVTASTPNGAATVPLSNQYLPIANNVPRNTSTQTLTVTLNPLNTYLQAPGTHSLTLYLYICD